MQLQEILDFVDNHPNTMQLPGSYKGLSVGRANIRAEMAGNRQVIITDRLTGLTVFVGSEAGIELIADGEWQSDVAEAVTHPPEGMKPPVLATGDSGDTRPKAISEYPGPLPNGPKPQPTVSDIKEEDIFDNEKEVDLDENSTITPEVLADTAPETIANIVAPHELEEH